MHVKVSLLVIKIESKKSLVLLLKVLYILYNIKINIHIKLILTYKKYCIFNIT